MTYKEAWDMQTKLHQDIVGHKMAIRKGEVAGDKPSNQLIFCEHSHVYTLGKSGSEDHLLLPSERLSSEKIEFFKINRGGDITYHGPGQITGYPIVDLEEFFTDVHKYVRYIEQIIINTIDEFGLEGIRMEKHTGVWLAPNEKFTQFRKICAIGVHLSRWVTMHGFAFNVNTDLNYFKHIIPCGIADQDKTVTSLQQELGKSVDFIEVKNILKRNFAKQFKFEYK